MNAFNKALSSKPPTSRPPGCTHALLTRKFDATENELCDICHRSPFLGWLYRCTQDYDGVLPTSDFFTETSSTCLTSDAKLYTLSDSVLNAAQRGHYTDEQLGTLWKQKARVRDFVRQAMVLSSSSTSSSLSSSSSQRMLTASTTFSTLQSSNSDTEPDIEFSGLSDQSYTCRSILEPIQEVGDDIEEDEFQATHLAQALYLTTSPPLPCSTRVCHGCRPIYKERSFQSIDEVILSAKTLPRHELNNKRISNATVLKDLNSTQLLVVPKTYYSMNITEERPLSDERLENYEETSSKTTKASVNALSQVSACHDLVALAAAANIHEI